MKNKLAKEMRSLVTTISLIVFTIGVSCSPSTKSASSETNSDSAKSNILTSNNSLPQVLVVGKWKCVAEDNRGFSKYSAEQVAQLKKSLLTIEDHQIFYEGVDFIDTCRFTKLVQKGSVEERSWKGTAFLYRYTKDELANIVAIEAQDEHGEWACYNNCAHFFIKGDTLINICGYTLFFKKI